MRSIKKERLPFILFPLGDYSKPQIREIALNNGLPNASRSDSQDICFIPDGDYISFIKSNSNVPFKKGNFVDLEGNVLGMHQGLENYTIGQRKGLGIALGQPVFIKKIDAETNRIYLAYNGGQFSDKILVKDCVYMLKDAPHTTFNAEVKIRSAARCESAVVTPLEGGCAEVIFQSPVKAPAPGQSAVFYLENRVLGGGFIM